jgi:hypothetical protein
VSGLLKKHKVGTLVSTSVIVGTVPIDGVNELTDSYIAFLGLSVDIHFFFSGAAVNGVVSINATSATADFLFCFTGTWPTMSGENLFLIAMSLVVLRSVLDERDSSVRATTHVLAQ